MLLSKAWGYEADESENTTHAVYEPVPDINTTESNFDGITYSKGASILKQLYFLVGESTFSQCMKEYFTKHAWKNTTFKDLVEVLQSALPGSQGVHSLEGFKKDWILTPGTNVLQASWDFNAHEINQMTIKQSAWHKRYPLLRYHKIKVGLYGDNGQLLQVIDAIVNNKAETVVQFNGISGVKGVVLNYDDIGFVKTRLDSSTLKWMKACYGQIQEPITRSLLLKAVFDQVKRADSLNIDYFTNLFKDIILVQERDSFTLEIAFDMVLEVAVQWPSQQNRNKYIQELFDATGKRLSTETDPMSVRLLTNSLISLSTREEDFELFHSWLQNKISPKCPFVPPLTLEQRWDMVVNVYASKNISKEVKENLFKSEAAKDFTDTKSAYEEIISGFTMSKKKREDFLDNLVDMCEKHSFDTLSSIFVGFNHRLLPHSLLSGYHDQYFKSLPHLIKECDFEVSSALLEHMMPRMEDLDELIKRQKAVVSKLDETEYTYFIGTLESDIDKNRMIKRIREYAEGGKSGKGNKGQEEEEEDEEDEEEEEEEHNEDEN